ncbi:MAG: hypothetical protein DSZ29_00670 [Aquificaceae bacterium]|nr:MAG: hypothetical protein DSZ29_00670 [Aquificaceae bacterium]
MKFWLPYFTILTALPCYAGDYANEQRVSQHTVINQQWGLVASVIRFDKKHQARFKLIDVASPKPKDNISNYWQGDKHSVIINGGYFGRDFSPVGYYKINNKVINKHVSKKLSGFIGIKKTGEIALLSKSDLKQQTSKSYSTLMQSGPYIIDPNGLLGIHHNNHKRYQRTVIASTRSGDILLISTAPISLYNLAHALKKEFPDIERALNLDGGPSSALMTSEMTLINRMPVRSYIMATLQ